MNYVVESSIFKEASFQMILFGVNACVEIACYGIYVSLFILAIHILARRKAAGNKLLVLYTCTMAIFGTAQVVICLMQTAQIVRLVIVLVEEDTATSDVINPNLLRLEATAVSLALAQQLVFVGNNLLSDSLFLYRCFVIWGSRWRPVVLPGVLMISTFGFACAVNITNSNSVFFVRRAPFILAAITNLTLVTLTCGRIWWIRRDALLVGADNRLRNRYNAAIAMILESGVLYAMFATALAITAPTGSDYTFVLQGIAMQLINIAPTMIIVRVGLGHNVQDVVPLRGQLSNLHMLNMRGEDNDPSSAKMAV
ncbi:hypothetical protein C8F04DRAFT_1088243 [Mycena alexandri]|uniref:Uncharacterized protein n=1 Tax=Mycena alexandri TaxID=1745969 RepID=A0AAD6T399_9AGAR|nr:hypothetical protein C8F04DRAFT_1088243 [Mycena alexandri]